MTLHDLTGELERIDAELQKLRRSDMEIPGDVAFAAGLRQHVVLSLGEIRARIDELVLSLDHVDDLDKVVGLRTRIMEKVRKAIGPGDG